ncbi:golgin subfamily A member 6-like protein 22 [Saccostrea echinata]|uniref:golgin subfamily A member 6-like protein 22 n=1 Tax=Saccostrea echinata TaxID=191078 RepID=UPI002A804D57|nr:golgin subfamily A member 6-like protein 22 [Saccostrea echinata]
MTERTRLTSAKSRRNNYKEQLLTYDRRGELESVQSSRKNQYGDNEYGPKENVRIEVLEEKIKVDSKNHDKEKPKIMSEKDQEIRSLEAENECLKIEVANKTDKIRQLSNANNKKEFLLEKREHDIKEMQKEPEILKKREESLNMEIKRLENEHTHISEMYKETFSIVKNQQDKMKSMEKEISSLKEELEKIKAEKAEKEEQERKLRAQVTSMVEEIKQLLTNDRRGELESVQSSRKNQNGDNKYGPKENVRIEVLEEKIKVDSKNHDKEKQKIMSEKNQEIRSLEAENECLKIEVAHKNDKIRQLSNANNKKEFLLEKRDHDIKEMQKENEILKKREENLHMEIKRLENEHKHMSETYKETISIVKNQQDEIKSMEIKISALKEELEKLKAEKEEQEKKLYAQLTSIGNKMEASNKEAQIREQERERKMEERERKREEEAKRRERLREEEWERREAKRDREAKENNKIMMEEIKKLSSALRSSTTLIRNDIKENATVNPNENLVITEAKNFSIQNDSHYYHGPRTFYRQQQPAINARGKIHPLVQCSFPSRIGITQNKRGGNPKSPY